MSASEDHKSSSSSEKREQKTESDEIEVFEQDRPYKGERPGHSSNDNENTEVYEDGLSPAILHSRFQGEVSFNKISTRHCTWAVNWSKFAETPGSLIHCLGLPEFPVRICDPRTLQHTRDLPNLSYGKYK